MNVNHRTAPTVRPKKDLNHESSVLLLFTTISYGIY